MRVSAVPGNVLLRSFNAAEIGNVPRLNHNRVDSMPKVHWVYSSAAAAEENFASIMKSSGLTSKALHTWYQKPNAGMAIHAM